MTGGIRVHIYKMGKANLHTAATPFVNILLWQVSPPIIKMSCNILHNFHFFPQDEHFSALQHFRNKNFE